MRFTMRKTVTIALGAAFALGVTTGSAQPAGDDYRPAQAGIRAGSASAGKPQAGSLGMGKPSAGSLSLGRPTAGSLAGSAAAGSIAPAVGVPMDSITVPMSSLGSPMGESLSRSKRPVVSDDAPTSRTRRSRSRR